MFLRTEFEKQRLGAIRPLQEMVTSDSHLHDDEDQWRTLCETRFCLTVRKQKSRTVVLVIVYVLNNVKC